MHLCACVKAKAKFFQSLCNLKLGVLVIMLRCNNAIKHVAIRLFSILVNILFFFLRSWAAAQSINECCASIRTHASVYVSVCELFGITFL